MPMHNADIAAIFEEIADLLEIEGANPFRVRAYRNAARSVGALGAELTTLVGRGDDLTDIAGIGDDLAAKIREIVTTGRCGLLERLHGELPPAIGELLRVPGLGPKRVRALWHDLDIQTLEQLQRAARDGRIRALPGFGERSEQKIRKAVEAHLSQSRRFKLASAAPYAEALVASLKRVSGVERVEVAGSYRRMRETVGDLDILVVAARDAAVARAFTAYDEVAQVLASGPTRASVVLRCGLQVDLRVVPHESYGAALCYFTGAKAHNVALRRLAQERGLKLNEYGLFRDTEAVAGKTEASVYRALDLALVPPELREDRGEIEAARSGKLPRLVERADLRGDLHVHTRASDGRDTLADMARAARTAGLEYIAITEHSQRLAMAHGLDAERLAAQIDEIDRLNETLTGIRLLKGIEVDILPDGRLDLPDAMLARLDIVVGAVHSHFELSRARQTERLLRAMDNAHFSLLAHPLGRLIDTREACDVDIARVIAHARDRGCFLELDAQPDRLDLPDIHCLAAREAGVLVAIDSDAHAVNDFANLRFGIGQARRGWLEAGDVLNTRTLRQLMPLLRRTHAR
ncbi:MAG TPA: DNA polymerase/3'-5' exonuclease PolX [Rhodocyclaceae bacterium]|nr:DNA polymerase/3'-5' exonuclease PolX [Rhodocyclaceae bacterium]